MTPETPLLRRASVDVQGYAVDVPSHRCHVALIGCGRWGAHILRDLLALGCEVSVVTRTDASAARAFELGATRVGTNMAAAGDVDGVVVSTPSATHAAIVRSVLSLGVPVFVEKPLTVDPADARELVEAAGDRIFVMDKWRCHPGVAKLGEIIRTSAIGEVSGLRTSALARVCPMPTPMSPGTSSHTI